MSRAIYKIISALLLMAGIWITPAGATGIDFSKAVVIGSGPKTVVEFTDPDCPFCRKASAYFDGRTDVTRYIFFYPLPRHPMAREKARFVLSQQNPAKAYHAAMSGALDRASNLETTSKGTKLQEEQLEIVKKAGITSTPTFMISGRIIEGFDLKRIEETLGPK